MLGKHGGERDRSSADSPIETSQTVKMNAAMNPSDPPAATRAPPPEKPASIRTRSLVIAAFWAVIVFLGLPMWWTTTSIYRARLPLVEMNDWASGKVRSSRSVLRYQYQNLIYLALGMSTGISATDTSAGSITESSGCEGPGAVDATCA